MFGPKTQFNHFWKEGRELGICLLFSREDPFYNIKKKFEELYMHLYILFSYASEIFQVVFIIVIKNEGVEGRLFEE